MPRRVPLPPALRGSAFTVTTGSEAGLSKSRLRSADLVAPFRGVRSSSEATSIVDLCRQYATRMRSTHFFSHHTAAAIHSIPLPWRFSQGGPLHVSAFERELEPRMRSPKETELRLLLVRGGLPEPQINVVIRNRYGAQIAIGDMV